VEEVLHLLSRTLGRGITIEKRLAESLPPVEGDATQLQQVVLNICINASEAMPDGGTLTITTQGLSPERIPEEEGLPSHPKGYVLLSIKDTGLGMSAEIRERLFEPFFTTKKEGGGTGLGLALVYSIVKQHQGFVKVSSEPNWGTEFKIYLPGCPGTEAPSSSPICQMKGGSETVLMVDDDEVIRDLTAEILQKVGYTVLKAANGEEALLELKSRKGSIDLVVLDMIVPGLEGGPTFERLRQLEPEMKILLTSGYNELSCPPGSLEKPGTAFIQKPYRVAELLTKVREVLEPPPVLSPPT
jgi:CheY-like chemotaxis protein